jgi:hypothetical protein
MGSVEAGSQEFTGFNPEPLLDPKNVSRLSSEWNVPEEDILLIALNASGIKYQNVVNDRGRFVVTLPDGRNYFLAVTISDKPLSPFEHKNDQLYFGGASIAAVTPIQKDTCTDSYWRGSTKHLTLNSNSRSNCKGCSFCGTYSLDNDDDALVNPNALRKKASVLQEDLGHDLSSLKSVDVVTGCFPNEQSLVEHLLMVRDAFSEFGFAGELGYIGSQLRSRDALEKVIASGPFVLHLTVEAFERRRQLMKTAKASLDLDLGRDVLELAKSMGAETSLLYIAGLDSHETMREQFPLYVPMLTRLPQIQTFQAYVPEQIALRRPEAAGIEYFLQTRKIVEDTFPHLSPIAAKNYRSLWYTAYGEQVLPNAEI